MRKQCTLYLSAIMVFGAMFTAMQKTASAATPTQMTVQGKLTNPGGTPQTGTFTFICRIYDAQVGGAEVWTAGVGEAQSVTTDANGLWTVRLGMTTALTDAVFAATERWLEVTVDDGAGGNPTETLARIKLNTNPFAYRIATVDGATGGSISGNINLDASSATAGNILKGGTRFIHNYGSGNTFIGLDAGNLTMTGWSNTASGAGALQNNTTGYGNTASGTNALFSSTTSISNTANGDHALYSNTTGHSNTASGAGALPSNTTGFGNTASGFEALLNNTTGSENTASGYDALYSNTTGINNTASGRNALSSNTTGFGNTAIGSSADVFSGALTNATAIGAGAVVNASNKIRLGDAAVTVIEGQVAYTFPSDKNQKENFRAVDGGEVLKKIRGLNLSSWNYIGHDPEQFRHYGPVAQEFFAAFGHDGVGISGTPTTINSGDEAGILMIAVQALERRTEELETIQAENEELRSRIQDLQSQIAELREMTQVKSNNSK